MKFSGLCFTVLSTLCLNLGVKGYENNNYNYNNYNNYNENNNNYYDYNNNVNNYDYNNNINTYDYNSNNNNYGYNNNNNNYENTNIDLAKVNDFISTLDPILRDADPLYDPFNLYYAATTNNNSTAAENIKKYENLYNISKDECLRGIYAYCIHMLEISYNLECNSKFNPINTEYKKNKPCYKVNPDMQNILDHGNAYLDLFCARGEDNKPCPFVNEIVGAQNNGTIVNNACEMDSKNRKKCDNELIQNYSIMIDASNKLKNNNSTTYASGGNTISLSIPKYNLTKIEERMKNKTCLVEIQPPQQVLVNSEPTKKNDTNKETSDADRKSVV